ncbi:hypothetical protein SMICM17S_06988 [Streptomyces microflavus]
MRGQGVQEGVARRVVRLTGGAEQAGDGGVQHERRQVQVAGQLVQVPGRVGLRPQDGIQALGGERGDRGVVQDTGRVDDAGQRMLRRYGAQQCGDLVAVGHIARGDRDLGARPGQLRAQFGRPRGVRAAPAHQQQVAHAVLPHQVPGEHSAERTGGAGHQDRAVAPAGGGATVLRRGGAGQPRDEQFSFT